jgi:hypothetical protein
MKSVVGPLAIAVLLTAAGWAFWIAGHTERRLAEMHQQLATLHYANAMNEGDEMDESMGLARRLPRVGDALAAETRTERAVAQYWRSDYAGLEPKRDAGGALTETDPDVLLVEANADFRTTQQATDRSEHLRRLDRAVKTYADVLKSNPSADAAYNYEYVVRLREAAQRARQAPRIDAHRLAQRAAADPVGDLPAGPTLHGNPGAPPKGTDMSQFKIVIPKRGEERKDNPEAGKGGAKVRKG